MKRNLSSIIVVFSLGAAPAAHCKPQASTVRRSAPPPSGSPSKTEVPKFTVTRLGNGLQVFLLAKSGMNSPIVHVELVSRGGSALDVKGHQGESFLAYLMAFNGGKSHSGHRFDQYLNGLSAAFDVDVQPDHAAFLMQGPARNLERMVELMADIVQHPMASELAFRNLRKLAKRRLHRRSADPFSQAQRLLAPLTFGRRHPYGQPALGDLSSLERLTYEALAKHRVGLLDPAESALIITGDVRPEEILGIAHRTFGGWKLTTPPKRAKVATTALSPDRRIHLLDRPESTQTLVCALQAVMGRGTKDARAFEVAAHILGGAFDARLQTQMRERAGYTYGVSTDIRWYKGVSGFTVCAKVQRAATLRACQDMLQTIEQMTTEPPDAQTIARAERNLQGRRTRKFESLHGSAGEAKSEFLRAAELATTSSTAAVSVAEISDVTARYLRAKDMRLLLVGDAAKIRDELGALDRGVVLRSTRLAPNTTP